MSQKNVKLVVPSIGRWNLSHCLDNRKVESITIIGFVLLQNAKAGALELLPGHFGKIGLANDLFHSLKSDKLTMIRRTPTTYVKLENDNGVFDTNTRKIIIPDGLCASDDPTQEFEISCRFSNNSYNFQFVASSKSVKAVIVEFILSEERVEVMDLQSKNQFIVPLSHNPNYYQRTKIKKSILPILDDNIKILVPYVKKLIFKKPAKENDYIWVSGKIVRLAIDKEIGQPQNIVLDTSPMHLISDYYNDKIIDDRVTRASNHFQIYNETDMITHRGFWTLSCTDYDDRYELAGFSDTKDLVGIIIEFQEMENTDQSIVNKMQSTNRAVNDYFVDPVSNLDFSSDNTQSARNNKFSRNTKEEKEMSKKVLGKVYGPVPDGLIAMDITGRLVIRPDQCQSYKRFNAKTGKMVDMLDQVFELNGNLAYMLPVNINTIVAGDIVVIPKRSNKEFYVVKKINDGVIKGINLSDSTMLDIIPESLVGSDISFVSKVVNLLNPGTLDPMLMLMVLGDEEDATVDTKTAMIMMMGMNNSGEEQNNNNMMLPLLLMDKSNGSIKDLMLPMLMMNQGNNIDMNKMLPLMLLGDRDNPEDDGNFKDLAIAMMMMNSTQGDLNCGIDSNMLLPLMLMDKSNGKKDMLLMMTMLQKQANLDRTMQLIDKTNKKNKNTKDE